MLLHILRNSFDFWPCFIKKPYQNNNFKCSKVFLPDRYSMFSSKFSVLSIDEVPDPERTHFLWGFSKDFGIASFRYGVLHTWNKDLMKIMEGMCLYSSVQAGVQSSDPILIEASFNI